MSYTFDLICMHQWSGYDFKRGFVFNYTLYDKNIVYVSDFYSCKDIKKEL